MTKLISLAAEVLESAKFNTRMGATTNCLLFEDSSCLGFLFAYSDQSSLVASWEADLGKVLSANQFGLRRAAMKAWNAYAIFLASSKPTPSTEHALIAIEEDLEGTRKIARSGVESISDVRNALLSLLPIQAPPRLEAVDISDEIRKRATELPGVAIQGFFSDADEGEVLQALEESQ